jgi:hypothetical protein
MGVDVNECRRRPNGIHHLSAAFVNRMDYSMSDAYDILLRNLATYMPYAKKV